MSNNDFDMGFREYFYYHPCCGCAKYDDCARRDGYSLYSDSMKMIFNRLERIMVDNDTDCWEGMAK